MIQEAHSPREHAATTGDDGRWDDSQRLARLRRDQLRRSWPWLLWLLIATGLGMVVVPATAALPLRVLVGLLVVPPLAALGWYRMQLIGRLDELQRRIEYQAIAIAFVLTLCLLLGEALLQDMHVPVQLSPLAGFWLIFATYLVAGKVFKSRYR